MYGRKHSPETIKKIKDKVGGENHPFYNKKRPQFAKKIKGVCTGSRNGMYNNTHTKENREKISKAQKGFNNSGAKINSKIANKIIKLRKEGKTQVKIAKKLNLGSTAVSEVCRGEHWTQNNVKWKLDVYKKEIVKKAKKIINEYKNKNIYQKDLAKKYGFHKETINKIVNKKHWTSKHLWRIKNG